jgi:hypothetical protein
VFFARKRRQGLLYWYLLYSIRRWMVSTTVRKLA